MPEESTENHSAARDHRAAIAMSKKNIRRNVTQAIKTMSTQERAAQAEQLMNALRTLPRWHEAADILAYIPMQYEPPLLPLLMEAEEAGKRVFVPQIRGKNIVFSRRTAGAAGAAAEGATGAAEYPESIWEPDRAPKSLLIAPGLAFTLRGGRLGRGGGFYDRFLAVNPELHSLALCFTAQLYSRIPVCSHDIPVSEVLLPEMN
ncbi:MAG: 5-formyltetrahydrofolate cyclo-ligase [Salinispira sp.]